MAYDEEEARRSRVVVETPTARREVVSQSVRTPDRSGISAGMVGVLVVVAIALITVMVLFWMSTQQNTVDPNANTVAQQQQPPTVVQQAPAQQPPVIIQQPAPAAPQQAPIIIQAPSGGSTEPATAANVDASIQAAIDKQLTEDPTFSTLGITATVMNAKVTLLGVVKTEAMKSQIEKMVKRTKGVKDVDNQISVIAD